jgi:hypothetical protein
MIVATGSLPAIAEISSDETTGVPTCWKPEGTVLRTEMAPGVRSVILQAAMVKMMIMTAFRRTEMKKAARRYFG